MTNNDPSVRRRRSSRSERGAVAGLEGVMLGVLVLVAGSVVVAHAWSVVQTRRTLDGAAREYLRSYTEADDPDAASAAGRRALDDVLNGEGSRRVDVVTRLPDPATFGPCARSTVSLSAVVPGVHLPFVGDLASTTVEVTHSELVDAHREMTSGRAYDIEGTPCGG